MRFSVCCLAIDKCGFSLSCVFSLILLTYCVSFRSTVLCSHQWFMLLGVHVYRGGAQRLQASLDQQSLRHLRDGLLPHRRLGGALRRHSSHQPSETVPPLRRAAEKREVGGRLG